MSEKPVLLLVTAETRDEAENLGEALLGQGLATRGSVIPGIHSFWLVEGKLERSHEAMLLVTTSTSPAAPAAAVIREHHSLAAPRLLALQVAYCNHRRGSPSGISRPPLMRCRGCRQCSGSRSSSSATT